MNMRKINEIDKDGNIIATYGSIKEFAAEICTTTSNATKIVAFARGEVFVRNKRRFIAEAKKGCGGSGTKVTVYDKDGNVLKVFPTVLDLYSAIRGIGIYAIRSKMSKKVDGWLPCGMKARREWDTDEGFKMLKFTRSNIVVSITIDGKVYRQDVTTKAKKVLVYYNGKVVKTFIRSSKLASFISYRHLNVETINRLITNRVDGWFYTDVQVRYEGDTDLTWTQCKDILKARKSYESIDFVMKLGRNLTRREREYALRHDCSIKEAVEAIAANNPCDVDDEERDYKKELEDTEAKIQQIERDYYDRKISVYERNDRLGWLQNHANVLRNRMRGTLDKREIAHETYSLSKNYDF